MELSILLLFFIFLLLPHTQLKAYREYTSSIYQLNGLILDMCLFVLELHMSYD